VGLRGRGHTPEDPEDEVPVCARGLGGIQHRLGCKGHYFTAHYTEDIEVFFRYTSHDAHLLINNCADPVFHFSGAPRDVGQPMFWKRSFGGRQTSVRVTCPS